MLARGRILAILTHQNNYDTSMAEQKTDRALPVLEIDDFGPIKSAKIEFRPLTVLVGANNTGKSYLTTLIYALHCAIANRYEMIHSAMRFRSQSEAKAKSRTDQYIDRLLKNALSEDSKKVVELGYEHVTNIVQSIFGDNSSLLFEIRRSFGIRNDSNLRRKFARRKRSLVRMIQPVSSYDHESSVLVSELGYGCQIEIVGPSNIQLNIEHIKCLMDPAEDQRVSFAGDNEHMRNARAGLARAVFNSVMPTLANRAYYLPADRTWIMHSHRSIVNGLISSASTAGLSPGTNIPALSGVLSDFLRELISIDEVARIGKEPEKVEGTRAALRDITDRIESSILNGSAIVNMAETINYPDFLYRPDGWKSELNLMNASSVVSEMTPLILYLRYLVKDGQTLIIEEPESHLHPKMQIQLTKLLALLVKAGIKVIVTTHSEWIVSCLNNIVLRKRNESAWGESLPNDRTSDVVEPALDVSEVGVWAFSKSSSRSGSRVVELKFSESGHYRPDFDDDLLDLHNEWATQASDLV